jgi:hypothetical protein
MLVLKQLFKLKIMLHHCDTLREHSASLCRVSHFITFILNVVKLSVLLMNAFMLFVIMLNVLN